MPPVPSSGDTERRLAALERAVEELTKAGSLSVSNGSVTLPPGTTLRVKDADGDVLLLLGGLGTTRPTDGKEEQGLVIRRDDNTVALSITNDGNQEGLYRQVVGLWDRSGRTVVQDDGASGVGLGRPYIPIPLTRARFTDMVAVTDAAFVDVFDSGFFYKMHPKARADVRCTTDAAGTTGEVRVLVDGVQVGMTVPVAYSFGVKYVGPFVVPGDFLSQHVIKVQARRTAGTGAVRLDPAVWGVQS